MAYMFLKGWNDGVVADKIIVGHWANLANTKYDYTADHTAISQIIQIGTEFLTAP